jgi:predicted CXXCH cytochrome family protein
MKGYSLLVRTIVLQLILFSLLMQTVGRIAPVVAASGSETIWGISQVCDFNITDPTLSIDGVTQGLDGKTASCQWEASAQDTSWTITEFSPTSFDLVENGRLEIAFSVSNWQPGNKLRLEVSKNGGKDWEVLEVFERDNPPPDQVTLKTYAFNDDFKSPAALQALQARLMVPGEKQSPSTFTILLDGVSVALIGEDFPTATPSLTVTMLVEETATASATETMETVPTGTATFTETVGVITPSSTVITPTITITTTITPTVTLTPTVIPSPSVTPFTALTLNTGADAQPQELWAVEQACDFTIQNPGSSLDQAFNDQAASCSGEFAQNQAVWQFTAFTHTTFTHIVDILLEVRFSVIDWADDSINLEIYNGSQWQVLDQFGEGKSIPPGSLLTLGYRVESFLASPEQVNQAALRLVGSDVNQNPDNMTIFIDAARLSVAGGAAGQASFGPMPRAAFDAVALIAALTANSPHGDQSILTDSCAACHSGHAGSGSRLRGLWPEEGVCFFCHGSSGPAINVQLVFVDFLNTATRFFTHDVMRTNGIHRLEQSGGSDFGGENRHVECEDCHDPHYAAGGSSAAPNLPPSMAGESGVDPVWAGTGSPSSYNWLDDATGEYQVCFKCHSSFTSLPSYQPDGWNGSAFIANGLRKLTGSSAGQVADSRDMAQEFNPAQTSFHPVAAQGRNQNIPPGSFVNGWTQTSLVYCTDCHSNPGSIAGGSGAHGSPLLHLLNGTANYSTIMTDKAARVSSGQVCFQCHNYQVYVLEESNSTRFKYHAKHMNNDWGTTCYTCHDSHGSEQEHLLNMDASAMTFINGRNSQTAWYYDPVTGNAGCFLSCHSKLHDPKEYTP